jgi:hypothetical protein
MRILRLGLASVCLFGTILAWAALVPVVLAQEQYTWTGANSNAWGDTCNWQPPGSCITSLPWPGEESDSDVVELSHTGAAPGEALLSRSVTLAKLSIGYGGRLIGASNITVTVTQGFEWKGGELQNVHLILESTAVSVAASDPTSPLHLRGGTIVNHGLFAWAGGDILLNNLARFENRNRFVAVSGGTFASGGCCLGENGFKNTGHLYVPPIAGTYFPRPVFENLYFRQEGGTIEVAAGSTLTVSFGMHFFSDSPRLEGDGQTIFMLGEFDLDGPINVSSGHSLVLRTTPQTSSRRPFVNGIATVQGGGTLIWQGGTIQGDITVSEDVSFLMEGDEWKNLNQLSGDPREAGRLTLNGHTDWSGAGDIRLAGQSVLLNRGTFIARSDAAIEGLGCCQQPSIFFNENGAFVKDGGTAVTRFRALSFLHSAPVDVRTGVLEIGLGPHTINDGARYEGAGRTRISDGQATLNGDLEVSEGATLELASGVLSAGGQLYGEGTIEGKGTFAWTGGTIGGDVQLATNLTLEISGPEAKYLQKTTQNAGRLLSHAEGTWREGTIVLSGAAQLTNAGTLAIESHATISAPSCCLNPDTFINTGRLVRRNDADTTHFVNVRFENRGEVELEEGVLLFGRPAPSQVDGAFLLRGGHVAARDSFTVLGGHFGGVGTAALLLINRGGTLAPGDTVGTLTVAEYQQTEGGRLEVDLAGTDAAQFDRLEVMGTALLAGILHVRSAGEFVPAAADTFRIVTAASVSETFGSVEAPEGWEVGVTYAVDHVLLGIVAATSTERDPEEEPPGAGGIPTVFALTGIAPNPFGERAVVLLDLPWPAEVTLELYDVAGRRVLSLQQNQPAGAAQALYIDGRGLVSGVYLFRATAIAAGATRTATGKVVILR